MDANELTAENTRLIALLAIAVEDAFNEGYDAGHNQGSDDTAAFESGEGSKHANVLARDKRNAWHDSDTIKALNPSEASK